MVHRLLLYMCLMALTPHMAYGHAYSDLQCHKCKKAPNHDACNNGIEVCKKDYTACITKVEKTWFGGIQISKGCSKPKYCKDPQPHCNWLGTKCSFCCYHDMCNVAEYPNPDNTDPCGCKPCLNGGTCNRHWLKFSCSCKPGFTGKYCENRVDKPDPCKGKPCKNGGTCWSCCGRWNCNCPPAFTGTRCEKRINPCKPDNPCLNGAKCVSSGATYKCRCKPGFTGDHCEHEKNACSGKPCKNGGTCQSHYCGYTCLCRPGFSGINCEKKIGGCFQCPKQSGMYPDPFNCFKFYQCCAWIPYHKDCPTDLHFNKKTGQCDWPWSADCTAIGITPDEDTYTCGIEQSTAKRQLTEGSHSFVWEEDEEDLEELQKEEQDEKELEELEKKEQDEKEVKQQLQTQKKETAREFIERNEERIDGILNTLVRIEDGLQKE